ncbi:spore coat protein I [Desulfotomaculum arcticum]|uniref:Spore coat protein I n=1 Tax=Desulfotruncus arcticus DSM 17038 TaxID=1121424 RepID=A0A1I2N3A0_9FIRM|nr:CotS family spore coat protein [Desulfotruncus arcticus]SFF98385.1 spore coat protein I [Desulfotomaculum arcticum] [Desulfotruncus arcticus DSM 17038]
MSSALYDIANTVLLEYGKKPGEIKIIQSGGIKTVWKIKSGNETLCLKRLRHSKDKALFSINAQKHMVRKGARVPGIFPALNGKDYVEFQGHLFVLYKWIEGRSITLSRDLKVAMEGLAQFHVGSAGYIPPTECRISSKLDRMVNYYQSVLKRFDEWQKQSLEKPQHPVCRAFLNEISEMTEVGMDCVKLLELSDYSNWVNDIRELGNLCHQDYGDGNALITSDGVYVLDLDGVTFDLPSRDLRKVIIKIMSGRSRWDLEQINEILAWYEKINPLDDGKRRVLYIDLLFPHELHDTAKNFFIKGKSIKPGEISLTCSVARRKIQMLSALIKGE